MKTHFRTLALTMCAVSLILVAGYPALAVQPGDEGPAGTDTWYHDLCHHWSHHYILTLWREGITNGFPFPIFDPGGGWEMGYQFEPDRPMTRAKLLYMMSKLFQLPPDEQTPSLWPDLHVTQTLYGHPAYGELRAAALKWEVAPGGDSLRLSATGRRFDAVEFIMAALNLMHYPQELSTEETDDILAAFVDEHQITGSDRPLVAAAVDLGLIIGYNDDTLRMYDTMTRAEAATILYRSCLMRVKPAYSIFHPDGDGYREVLPIEAVGLRNTAAAAWQVSITNRDGEIISHLPGTHPQPGEPGEAVWDGTDNSGSPLACGTYFVGGFVQNADGRIFDAVRVPIRLSRRHLQCAVDPPVASLGKHFHLMAETRGGADHVQAAVPDGTDRALHPAGQSGGWSLWERQIRACEDHGFSPGSHTLEVKANYSGAVRTETVPIEITDPAGSGGEGDEIPELVPVLTR